MTCSSRLAIIKFLPEGRRDRMDHFSLDWAQCSDLLLSFCSLLNVDSVDVYFHFTRITWNEAQENGLYRLYNVEESTASRLSSHPWINICNNSGCSEALATLCSHVDDEPPAWWCILTSRGIHLFLGVDEVKAGMWIVLKHVLQGISMINSVVGILNCKLWWAKPTKVSSNFCYDWWM